MNRLSHAISSLPLLALLGSCGGPNIEAKAANAVQTLMAYTAEALLLNGGGGVVTQKCSGGGDLSYDASTIPAIIDPNVDSVDIAIIFDDCIIKVCGDDVTFKSSTTATRVKINGLDAGDVANLIGGDAIIGADDQFFEIELISEDQEVSGFINGSLSYGYKMRIIGNENGLKDISIVESDRAESLEIQKKTLPASQLEILADRC